MKNRKNRDDLEAWKNRQRAALARLSAEDRHGLREAADRILMLVDREKAAHEGKLH